jgi:uncharacterized SAM-binding protein YcdF (DUF218 family)
MQQFLYNLKGQATIMNGLVLLIIVAFLLLRYKRKRLAIYFFCLSAIVFLISSTSYLPHYIADKMERKFVPFRIPSSFSDTEKVLIHVLGSGYTLDKRLPANAQIGLVALGRLAEAIRIHRAFKNSAIVCSGYSALGLETQAQVTRRAAIVLGVDSNNLITLNKPSTTSEEAVELGLRFPTSQKLVLVTDALHMNRAMKSFRGVGFTPIAAPTNFKVNEGPDQYGMKWFPSLDNIGLMNYVIHEWLGNLKASIFK